MVKRVYLKIFGLVQGVNFRFFAKQMADSLNLAGRAKNEDDGSLMIEVQGEEEKLTEFVGYCQKGPKYASVREIRKEWLKPDSDIKGFKITS